MEIDHNKVFRTYLVFSSLENYTKQKRHLSWVISGDNKSINFTEISIIRVVIFILQAPQKETIKQSSFRKTNHSQNNVSFTGNKKGKETSFINWRQNIDRHYTFSI